MKIDMLEVKKDRLKEIDKQLKNAYKFKKISEFNKSRIIIPLKAEKKILLQEIKDIENKRGVING